jgi:hypothetical protein
MREEGAAPDFGEAANLDIREAAACTSEFGSERVCA